MNTRNIQSAFLAIYSLIRQTKIRAIIYTVVFFCLWGYRLCRFIIHKPIDILTNWGTAEFVPALSQEDIILMIGRGSIMYAIYLICIYSIIEGILKFTGKVSTFFRTFIILFILLAVAEMYWERNYQSLILTYTNLFLR